PASVAAARRSAENRRRSSTARASANNRAIRTIRPSAARPRRHRRQVPWDGKVSRRRWPPWKLSSLEARNPDKRARWQALMLYLIIVIQYIKYRHFSTAYIQTAGCPQGRTRFDA